MTRTNPATAPARRTLLLAALVAVAAAGNTRASDAPATGQEFLQFVRARAADHRVADAPPRSLDDWKARRPVIRARLAEALGTVPSAPPAIEPRTHGTLDRDGYRVEKVSFQTMPGVRMTANLYLPRSPGRHAAVLAVHGHWHGAKQDPVVQSRCIGAAKLGFVVLAVDAFGAGERGVGTALGEYHGGMTAATLFPSRYTLAGLQVYENRRALEFLRARPEVDPDRVGVSGASGGGNQTMYAAALIDGLKAAAPVCSVGNYRAYLGIACCLCEMVPGALTFAEEWGVLGQFAPRGLLIVNASRDAVQFSVPEAKKTVAGLEAVYRLQGAPDHLKHAVFESGHDYNRAMRQAVYGWFTLHLKGEGDGSPVDEPAVKAEDPESLRCYPGDTRPADFVTLPRFAAAEGKKLLAAKADPADAASWKREAEALRKTLVTQSLGGFPRIDQGTKPEVIRDGDRTFRFSPEPGIRLSARSVPGAARDSPRAVLIDLDGTDQPAGVRLADELRRAGWAVVTTELRATGKLAWPSDTVGNAPDHNTAEWGLLIGRPLLGQWAFDVRRLLDALEASDETRPCETALIGVGPGGLVALVAAATDPRVTKVAAVGALASFVSDEPYKGQRLGVIAPGIVREVGDVAHLAALVAPRRVVIAGGVSGGGKPLDADTLRAVYRPALHVWDLLGAKGGLIVLGGTEAGEIVGALK